MLFFVLLTLGEALTMLNVLDDLSGIRRRSVMMDEESGLKLDEWMGGRMPVGCGF